jgi:hypothetical protein
MKKLMLLAVLFTTFLTSCKKDECPKPTYPIEGSWNGKYGNGTATPSSGYAMVIDAGGTLTVANAATISGATASNIATGTWTLTGNVFKATYTYPGGSPLAIQANFTNSGKLESGTWGSAPAGTNGGTWFMDRRN